MKFISQYPNVYHFLHVVRDEGHFDGVVPKGEEKRYAAAEQELAALNVGELQLLVYAVELIRRWRP
jgi:hypothetical protein